MPRSASMGLIMFGGIGLVTLILTWRLFIDGTEIVTTAPPDEPPESLSEADVASRREFFGQSLCCGQLV